MNKTKFFGILVIGLLLSNVLLIVMFFTQKKADFDHDKPRNAVIERLHFNQNQIRQYDELIRVHRREVHENDDELRSLKQKLYKNLSGNSIDTSKVDSLIQRMGELQEKIETVHFNHFLDIKKLCNTEQLKDFDALTKEIERIFFKHHPRKK